MLLKNSVLDSGIHVVLSGFDTLYMGFYVDVKGKMLEFLGEKRKEAEEAAVEGSGEVQVSFSDMVFTVKAVGYPRYPYVLKNSDLEIRVCSKNEVPFPNVYVHFYSVMLWSDGAEKAVEKVRSFVGKHFGEIKGEKVSRVDLCADFAGIDLTLQDMSKFITKAQKRVIYVVRGDKISGFEFGNGKIVARVYDKTKESKKHKKEELMRELWGDEVGEEETVYRVEFELKRDFLKEYSIETFEDLKEKSGDIWSYLTEEWLSMRELDNDNTTRRTGTKFWEKVKSVREFFGPVTGAVRETARKAHLPQLIKVAVGCFTSMGAIIKKEDPFITFESVLGWFITAMKEELAGKAGSSSSYTEEDVSRGFFNEVERKAVRFA